MIYSLSRFILSCFTLSVWKQWHVQTKSSESVHVLMRVNRLTHSTLKAYVAALLAYRAPLGGLSVGRHPLVTRFLQRLRPPARWLMLCGGSGCYSIASSPLLSPLGDQDSLLRSWPSGRRPRPLSHVVFLSPKLCSISHLAGICQSGGVGISFPKASQDAARVPEEERLGLRM